MEKQKLTTGLLLIVLYLFIATPNANARSLGKEKVARIHFFVHHRTGTVNQTVYIVANSSISATSPTAFGRILVLDDLLTEGPDTTSAAVGRVQGLTTLSDFKVVALAFNLNFVFTSGKYNGSTISIAGRDDTTETLHELPVIGGTGLFRLARGYALTTTYSKDTVTNKIVIEYNMFVVYSQLKI